MKFTKQHRKNLSISHLNKDVTDWVVENQGKHFCHCGCNREIIIKRRHKYDGIPMYIFGHGSIGYNPSKETRDKISKSLKNKTPWNKGIGKICESYKNWLDNREKIYCQCGCSKEIIIKSYHKKYGIPKYISGHNKSTKGCKFSNEHKKNLSISHVGLPPNKGCGTGIGDYYDSPLQGTIWLRSSYEIAYAKYLDKNKILWMYEMETFDLGNTTYTPDFFLPKFEKFIDTKGYMRKESQEKIKMFLEQYPWDLEILYKKDLIKLGVEL